MILFFVWTIQKFELILNARRINFLTCCHTHFSSISRMMFDVNKMERDCCVWKWCRRRCRPVLSFCKPCAKSTSQRNVRNVQCSWPLLTFTWTTKLPGVQAFYSLCVCDNFQKSNLAKLLDTYNSARFKCRPTTSSELLSFLLLTWHWENKLVPYLQALKSDPFGQMTLN